MFGSWEFDLVKNVRRKSLGWLFELEKGEHFQMSHLLPEKDEQSIIDYVYNHMIDVAFGEGVADSERFCNALKLEILPRMMDTIKVRNCCDINIKVATQIGMKFLGNEKMKKEDEKRMCLEAAFIMLVISRPDSSARLIKSKEEMLGKYPEFSAANESELRVLISFRNVMVIAMQSICPRYNKNRLLTLVTRIVEGRGKRYVTGSGQTECTSKRVLIYERESGISPVPRPKPAIKEEFISDTSYATAGATVTTPGKGRKRLASNASMKEHTSIAKRLGLDPEDQFDSPATELRRAVVHLSDLKNSKLSAEAFAELAMPIKSEESSAAVEMPYSLGPAAAIAQESSIGMERLHSLASSVSAPDVEIFKAPFLDLYSRETQSEYFTDDQSFFTALSRVASQSSQVDT